MAFYDSVWFANAGDQSTTGYYAVAKRPQNTAVTAGQLVRQFTAPAVGSERVFVCIVAGTTANTTDATWVLTRGAKTTDGTATWMECTGMAAVNGDSTDTVNWTTAKALATPSLGAILQRNSGASFQICTTAGTLGNSEPAFSNTAGVTTTEGAPGNAVWTSLGAVGNFTGGQAPHARLANASASTWFAAGNTIYVGDNHAESQATAITINPNLSQPTMSRIICHNHSGGYPPTSSDLASTATISTTAAVALNFTPATGSIYVYGLSFVVGSGAATAALLAIGSGNSAYYFDNCTFKIATTAGSQYMDLCGVSGGGAIVWNNCKVGFAATSQFIHPSHGNIVWQNTGQVLAAGSSVPTVLINSRVAAYVSSITLEALDLSQVTAVFGVSFTSVGNWIVKDCKLHASATFANPAGSGQTVQYIRADGGATAYKSARYQYEGTETTETSITRVGGAADPTGQAQSRKIVTTANAQWLRPFRAEPYAIWNPTTASNVTVTVCGTINSGSLPNNDEIWMEVEYLGSSTFPVGTIVTTTKSNVLAAGSAVTSDGSTWNGGGSGGGWSPFKLAVTLSSPQPAMAGYIHARVRAGKASTTYYLDPQITLT